MIIKTLQSSILFFNILILYIFYKYLIQFSLILISRLRQKIIYENNLLTNTQQRGFSTQKM